VGEMIPFNVPYVPEISKQYVLEALESSHQQGDGPFTGLASKMVSDLVGGGHVLLTPSCTHALEMASMLANLGPGDEVILPSYTFTSAATAVTKFGATPVFVDIEIETKVIDVNQVREAITPKTKAISWVNYAGVAPDIEGLQALAKEFGLLLIEDNAHGLGGSHKGKPLGGFGDFATQSFHATKNIQCGEGGALVINNPKYIERAEIIREKGTDRSKYIRGEVQKYQWVDKGSSYLLAEVLSAVLLGQLENFFFIQEERLRIWNSYFTECKKNSNLEYFFNLPKFGESINIAHMFYLEAKRELSTTKLMKQSSLSINLHYQSLHSSKEGKNYSGFQSIFPISTNLSKNLIRFPIWIGLSERESQAALGEFLELHYATLKAKSDEFNF
jgi:dTDP-4-amino-4,6-dideoxygalactose transaminase